MVDYASLAATAQRLIDANGRSVTLIKQGTHPQNHDEPWRGQSSYPVAEVTGGAVFVAASDLGHMVEDTEGLKRAEKVALFAADADEGNQLELFDVLKDGNVRWLIKHAEVLQPGNIRLVYVFGVSR